MAAKDNTGNLEENVLKIIANCSLDNKCFMDQLFHLKKLAN
jgi:hypothetical protein